MGLNIELLQKLCNNRSILYSTHSLERLQERGILRKDIVNGIMNGEIIEQYPDDTPFPSCLILGSSAASAPLHIVCACNGEIISIITAYYPTADKFESDNKTRKGKAQ